MLRICLALALFLSAFPAGQATAAEPLEAFSQDVAVVIRLHAPKTTAEKVASLADAVQPGVGDMIRQQGLSKLVELVGLTGVDGLDQSRDFYLAVYASPDREPFAVAALPCTNADDVVNSFRDADTNHRVDEDWIYYASPGGEVPPPAASGQNLSLLLTGEPASVFDKGDLSLFINAARLTETFADQIDFGHARLDAGLEQAAQSAPKTNGMNLEVVFDMYGTLFDKVFQAVEDADVCSAAINISDSGITIEEYVAFADGSATSGFLASHPTSEFETLDQLPPGGLIQFGMSGDMQRFMEWGWKMNSMMLGEDRKEEFAAAMDAWKDIKFKAVVGSLVLGNPATGLIQYSAIAQASPTDGVRKNMLGMMDILGEINAYGIKQTMSIEQDAETISGKSIDLFTIKQEIDPELDPAGMQKMMQGMMFGPEGMVSRMAYFDDFYVQTMGGGPDAMEAAIQAATSPASSELPEGLLDKSNLALLIDLPRLGVSALQAATQVPNVSLPVDADTLAGLEFETSYLGVTIRGESNALRSRTVIPVQQLQGVMMLVGLFQQ